MKIRRANNDDVKGMVELSDLKRTEYAQYSPVFWRKADGASEMQAQFFRVQLSRENVIALVAEESELLHGFIIASVSGAPPVYNPGGKVCVVDDFMVSSAECWQTVGRDLLTEARTEAKTCGAVLCVVVCGHLDQPKRSMLQESGATIASEWYVDPIS